MIGGASGSSEMNTRPRLRVDRFIQTIYLAYILITRRKCNMVFSIHDYLLLVSLPEKSNHCTGFGLLNYLACSMIYIPSPFLLHCPLCPVVTVYSNVSVPH